MKNQQKFRKAFWAYLEASQPDLYKFAKKSKGQKEQITDIRLAFCDYVEQCRRDGIITEKFANIVTL